jgi:hypothetical protein
LALIQWHYDEFFNVQTVQDALVLSEAAMFQIGGSGPAQTIKNGFLYALFFNQRMILPLEAIGFMRVLRLILSVHKNYQLKRLSYFGVFSVLTRMGNAVPNAFIGVLSHCFRSRAYESLFLIAAVPKLHAWITFTSGLPGVLLRKGLEGFSHGAAGAGARKRGAPQSPVFGAAENAPNW